MAYRDFKDLIRGTASGNVLRKEAFSIAENPKYDGYQRGLASMVYMFCFLIKRLLVEQLLCHKMNN